MKLNGKNTMSFNHTVDVFIQHDFIPVTVGLENYE